MYPIVYFAFQVYTWIYACVYAKKSHWYILRIEPTDFDSHCIYFEYTQLYHVRSWRIQCLRIPLRDTMHRRWPYTMLCTPSDSVLCLLAIGYKNYYNQYQSMQYSKHSQRSSSPLYVQEGEPLVAALQLAVAMNCSNIHTTSPTTRTAVLTDSPSGKILAKI